MSTDPDATARRAARAVGLSFLVAVAGVVVFVWAYWYGWSTQWLGAGLGLATGGIGWGLIAWGHRLMPQGPDVEERESLELPDEEAETALLFRGRAGRVQRRGLLGGLLATALGGIGLTMAVPVRSLGPRPRDQLATTPWGIDPPTRLVTAEGRAVVPGELQIGGLLTVFPEGHPESADGQTLLLRLSEAELARSSDIDRDAVAAGNVAFSKVCTHSGCPVGLYQPDAQVILCPCHQSSFDVLSGARPTRGPAVRRLPQLPLDVDDDGYLVATGDFPDPIGPGYWTRPAEAGP